MISTNSLTSIFRSSYSIKTLDTLICGMYSLSILFLLVLENVPIVHFSVISFVKIVLSFSLLCSFEFEEFIFKNTYLRSDFITSKCTSCYILSPDLQWKYREIWEAYLISKTPDENFHKTIGVRKNNPFMNRYREREHTTQTLIYSHFSVCKKNRKISSKQRIPKLQILFKNISILREILLRSLIISSSRIYQYFLRPTR